MKKFVKEILENISSDLEHSIESELKDIKASYDYAIENYLVKGIRIEKLDDGSYYFSFVTPEVFVKGDEVVIDNYKEDGGIAYGYYIGDAIKEYIEKNPEADPKKILRDIWQGFYMLMDEIVTKLELEQDCYLE